WNDNWARKVLEREILEAYSTGAEQVAIPISGQELASMAREGFPKTPGEPATAVQKWYEEYMPGMMSKVAKSMGAEFKMVGVGADLNAVDVANKLVTGDTKELTAQYGKVFTREVSNAFKAFSPTAEQKQYLELARVWLRQAPDVAHDAIAPEDYSMAMDL